MDAPGLPGCFPRFFFSARSAARRCFRGGFRPGRPSELGGIEEFPLFRDPARAAVSSCSRRPATVASSAAICPACAAISCVCSRISASRGSSDGSPGATSVTARHHPGNHAHPPRQHHARRWNVTHDYSPQHQAQGPECLRSIRRNPYQWTFSLSYVFYNFRRSAYSSCSLEPVPYRDGHICSIDNGPARCIVCFLSGRLLRYYRHSRSLLYKGFKIITRSFVKILHIFLL